MLGLANKGTDIIKKHFSKFTKYTVRNVFKLTELVFTSATRLLAKSTD